MRTEIYIENQQLDLYRDISAEFTYNIDDVKDFSSRNTNFSKSVSTLAKDIFNHMTDGRFIDHQNNYNENR